MLPPILEHKNVLSLAWLSVCRITAFQGGWGIDFDWTIEAARFFSIAASFFKVVAVYWFIDPSMTLVGQKTEVLWSNLNKPRSLPLHYQACASTFIKRGCTFSLFLSFRCLGLWLSVSWRSRVCWRSFWSSKVSWTTCQAGRRAREPSWSRAPRNHHPEYSNFCFLTHINRISTFLI